jgi:hypothetical protein
VSKLEEMLVELGRSIREPEPPDLVGRVASTLRRDAARSRRRWRVALTAAIGAAALAAVFAVTPARTALLRVFHLGGISVVRVDRLPPVAPAGPIAPGRELGFEEAKAHVTFPVSLPGNEGRPDHSFFFGAGPPGGQLTFIYGKTRSPKLLITEFVGTNPGKAFFKEAGPRTTVEVTSVDGARAIWLGGATHFFSFVDGEGATRYYRTRLAGNTLVWQREWVTLRLEGKLTKRQAIKLAESFEPAG